jgi:signal transduction histidine kinase
MPIPWEKIALSLGDHLQWGLVAPFVVWFCARRPVTRADLVGATLFQVAAWVIFPALFVLPIFGWRSALASSLGRPELAIAFSTDAFLRVYVWVFLAYLDVVVVAHAFYYARELRARELKASQLETRLAEARLDVLRMQIHPHFLFNTLNSIATLMHRDVASAERMLVLLGDLLRDSLARGASQTASLERELEFLDKYIEIESNRFGDRLSVVRDVDPATLSAEVPSLLLQPLVENALRHGLARKPGPGRLTLCAALADGSLEIRVRDDGPGVPDGVVVPETGVGLANTRARLEEMYGRGQSFDTRVPEGGGFEVVVRLPYRPSGVDRPLGVRARSAEVP